MGRTRDELPPATAQEALSALMVDQLRGLAAVATGERPAGRKAELVALVARQLAGDGAMRVYERLGELEQAAAAEAVHTAGGRFDAVRFRAKYGRDPEWGTSSWRGTSSATALDLLFCGHRTLPADIRANLLAAVPEPRASEVRSDGAPPAGTIVETEHAAQRDLHAARARPKRHLGGQPSETQRAARLAGESRSASTFQRGKQLLNWSSSRPGARLQLQDAKHSPSVGIECGGEKLVGSENLDAVTLQAVAQVAAVMREQVVGVRDHRQSAHVMVCGIGGQAAEVSGGRRLSEVDAPSREVPREVFDPPSRDLACQALLIDERICSLGQQLLAPEDVKQTQLVRDASQQLVQNTRVDDVGIEDRTRRVCIPHSGGAPIASRSRDHSSVSSRARSRRSSKASTDASGIFQ